MNGDKTIAANFISNTEGCLKDGAVYWVYYTQSSTQLRREFAADQVDAAIEFVMGLSHKEFGSVRVALL